MSEPCFSLFPPFGEGIGDTKKLSFAEGADDTHDWRQSSHRQSVLTRDKENPLTMSYTHLLSFWYEPGMRSRLDLGLY